MTAGGRLPFLLPGWLLVALLPLIAPFIQDWPLSWQLMPFAVSLVFLGLPHGAVDHLVPGRLTHQKVSTARLILFIGGYIGLAVIYLLFWTAWPLASAVFFIGLTWFHWGQGDLYFAPQNLTGRAPPTGIQRALGLIIRGALPMAVPLLAYPEIYVSVVESWTALFSGDGLNRALPLSLDQVRIFLGGGVAGLAAIYFIREVAGSRLNKAVLVDFLEVAGLALYFWTVPPLLAVGLYFCLWHSLRHIGRLVELDAKAPSPRQGFKRFVRDSAPLTFTSILFLLLLELVVPFPPEDWLGRAALYLVLISALTLPHTLVVAWMDWREPHPHVEGQQAVIMEA